MISSYRPPGFSVTITCWSNASRTPTTSFVTCVAPVGRASGRRRADRHLQLHDGVVQGLAAFPRLAERRRQLVLGVHHCTLRARRDDAQTGKGGRGGNPIRRLSRSTVIAARTIRESRGESYVDPSNVFIARSRCVPHLDGRRRDRRGREGSPDADPGDEDGEGDRVPLVAGHRPHLDRGHHQVEGRQRHAHHHRVREQLDLQPWPADRDRSSTGGSRMQERSSSGARSIPRSRTASAPGCAGRSSSLTERVEASLDVVDQHDDPFALEAFLRLAERGLASSILPGPRVDVRQVQPRVAL